jgi:hypothetical protein
MKRHFTNTAFTPVRPLPAAPGPLKGCQRAWSDKSMHLLRLTAFWALNVKYDLMQNKKPAVIKLITWLRYLLLMYAFNQTKKPLISRHMFISMFLHSSFLCIYLYISRINQQMHNVFVLYLYLFSLFPWHVSVSTCHSQAVHSNYIKLYRAMTRDS